MFLVSEWSATTTSDPRQHKDVMAYSSCVSYATDAGTRIARRGTEFAVGRHVVSSSHTLPDLRPRAVASESEMRSLYDAG